MHPRSWGQGNGGKQKEVRHIQILTLLLLGEEPCGVKHHREEDHRRQETSGAAQTTQKRCGERKTSLRGSLDVDASTVSPGRWGKKTNNTGLSPR